MGLRMGISSDAYDYNDSIFGRIPCETLKYIFEFLPISSWFNAKLTCKYWACGIFFDPTINDYYFMKEAIKKGKLDHVIQLCKDKRVDARKVLEFSVRLSEESFNSDIVDALLDSIIILQQQDLPLICLKPVPDKFFEYRSGFMHLFKHPRVYPLLPSENYLYSYFLKWICFNELECLYMDILFMAEQLMTDNRFYSKVLNKNSNNSNSDYYDRMRSLSFMYTKMESIFPRLQESILLCNYEEKSTNNYMTYEDLFEEEEDYEQDEYPPDLTWHLNDLCSRIDNEARILFDKFLPLMKLRMNPSHYLLTPTNIALELIDYYPDCINTVKILHDEETGVKNFDVRFIPRLFRISANIGSRAPIRNTNAVIKLLIHFDVVFDKITPDIFLDSLQELSSEDLQKKFIKFFLSDKRTSKGVCDAAIEFEKMLSIPR
jgi:hypothetical protein